MKALVISGGGCKGAFAGGVAEYLLLNQGKKYDMFVGCSVGSIMINHLALGNVSLLKETFTNITNKKVFSISPFIIKKNKDEFDVRINHFNTLRSFLKGCNTFGESKKLRKLLKRTHSIQDFETLKKTTKIIFTVSNLTNQSVEYKDISECSYEDYIDWMWASANYVPFMSLMTKNGCQYADGGFGSHVPIRYAVENGATEIDVIVLDSEKASEELQMFTNPFQSLMGAFKFMSNQIGMKDVLIGILKGKQANIDVRLWFCPENLTDNPLFFNPVQMKKWWEMGYYFAQKNEPICHCFTEDGKIFTTSPNQ